MKSYSEQLADHVLSLSFDQIPAEVIQKAKHILLDTVGVIILGADAPWSQAILRHFAEQGGAPEAEVVYHGLKLPMTNAAFVNGTMAHSFDYDDDLAACHIACCVVPAALAVGQKMKATGREVLTAMALGYDFVVRLAETLDAHHLYGMGFHPTAVCGTYGALAAASRLLKLNHAQIVHAQGIAASFVSGSLEWLSDGSMTKRFHGGKAAYEGLLSASLAAKGFTAPPSIYEGKNGIFKMYQAQRPPQRLVQDLGQRFDIAKSYLKYYPCCTCNAPIIDAVLALRNEAGLKPQDVRAVEVRVRQVCMALVGEPLEHKQSPGTALDAQMSAPYCVAAALLKGQVFPEQFSPQTINDPAVKGLAKKVKVIYDPQLDLDGDPRPVPAEVAIELSDRRVLRKRIDYQKGTYRNPLTTEELNQKFNLCVQGRFSQKRAQELVEKVQNLEEVTDLNLLSLSQ